MQLNFESGIINASAPYRMWGCDAFAGETADVDLYSCSETAVYPTTQLHLIKMNNLMLSRNALQWILKGVWLLLSHYFRSSSHPHSMRPGLFAMCNLAVVNEMKPQACHNTASYNYTLHRSINERNNVEELQASINTKTKHVCTRGSWTFNYNKKDTASWNLI